MNDNVITTNITSRSRVASDQWDCIFSLENRYRGVRVPGTINRFEDVEWSNGESEKKAILWKSIFNEPKYRALQLFLKIVCLNKIICNDVAIGSLKHEIYYFSNVYGDCIKEHNVLVGCVGEFILGIDAIAGESSRYESIILAFDMRAKSKLNTNNYATLFDSIGLLSTEAVNDFPPFRLSLSPPWDAVGGHEWARKRIKELRISIPEIKPFLALPSDTSQLLIEKSIMVVDDFSDVILDIFRQIRRLKKTNEDKSSLSELFYQSPPAKNMLTNPKYAQVLGKIVPYEINEGGFIKQSWYIQLFELLNTACINIILLTTGIRNYDVRRLKKGCCNPSGRVDMLYYISATIKKTRNAVHLPVPAQTNKAVRVLEEMKWSDDHEYLVVPIRYPNRSSVDKGDTLNMWLSRFANHFNIPFIKENRDSEQTAHCYRATVAGWLSSSSKLSVLLVRRLFGHRNQLMPLAYLHHNPIFRQTRDEAIERAAARMSGMMARDAVDGKLGGIRGEDLEHGFKHHKNINFSLTDKELRTSFQERIKARILDGTMYAMMTPLSVICTRNPNDSSQTPCAKKANKQRLKELQVDIALLNHMQTLPFPEACVGKQCSHAVIGTWSKPLKESFCWYIDYLEGHHGREFDLPMIAEQAKDWIALYAPEMKKIFGIGLPDE